MYFYIVEVKLYFSDGLWMNLCESNKQVLFRQAPLISFLTVPFVVVNKVLGGQTADVDCL